MKKYELIDKTEDYIVINKPTGLLTHGAPHTRGPALTDALVEDFPEIATVGDDPGRPGIVHRLDRLVSGLLVVARTQESFYNLKRQFQKRSIIKKYTALVYGQIEKPEDDINFPIERSSKGHKMAAKPTTVKGEKNDAGREAITDFIVIKRFINFTLLEVRIKTGRTHQIRVHMAAYGHPLVGDELYGTKKTKVKNETT